MARKRHNQDQELPFVALMDTMTNVVGVLTIVLVMIGLSLASAVSKVFSSLPSATPEQIAGLKAEMDKLIAERDRLKALLDDVLQTKAPPPKFVRLPAGASPSLRREELPWPGFQ